ncbi:MAG: sugar transferase [Candidatus Marinimicrobia bacterium]|nr:sugar transferase [Candidatus Neomarinimicrobiota bacterium]
MSNRTVHRIKTHLSVWLTAWFIFILDSVAGFFAYQSSLRPAIIDLGFSISSQVLVFVLIQVVWGIVLFIGGLYSGEPTTSRFGEVQNLLRITFSVIVLVVFADALFPTVYSIRAGLLFKYWLIFIIISIPLRISFRTFQKYLLRVGIGRRRTIIVGINQRGIRAEQEILDHDQQGFDVIGFVQSDDDPNPFPSAPINILGPEKDIKQIIIKHQVSDVVLALEKPEHNRLMSVINQINGAPISIKIVPDLYEVISGLARTQQLYGLPLLDVNPNLDTLYYRAIKRIFDVLVASISLLVITPLWALIALLIKLDSRGAVLFKQIRVGHNNNQFTIYKFRSMIDNAEATTGPVWAAEEDERITRVGKWLRRFRLDEIPQLINVIKGDMSLVGPRPERPYFVDKLLHEYPFYYRRHKVLPGVSGWSQIKHPYDSDLEDVRQKLKYDFFYIESLSFTMDFMIILNTIWVVLSGKGR